MTLGKVRERMAGAQRVRDLPRKEDGATRLARLLLTADKIHFLVGLAVNPAQTTDSWRSFAPNRHRRLDKRFESARQNRIR